MRNITGRWRGANIVLGVLPLGSTAVADTVGAADKAGNIIGDTNVNSRYMNNNRQTRNMCNEKGEDQIATFAKPQQRS